MKKRVLVLLGIMVLSLAGCGSNSNGNSDAGNDVYDDVADGVADDTADAGEEVENTDSDNPIADQEADPDHIADQIALIAANRDLWLTDAEYADEVTQCVITDLDWNGRLEIVASNMGGTGNYTYTTVYEVNEAMDSLELCPTNLTEFDSQADIINGITVAYEQDGYYYYLASDSMKVSAAEYYSGIRMISLIDGNISEETLAYQMVVYGDDETPVTTYYYGDNTEITQEEYDSLLYNYFVDFTQYEVSMGWMDQTETAALDEGDLIEALTESYSNFLVL